MATPIVFFDLVARDLDALSEFYSEIFGWDISAGPFPNTANIGPVPTLSPLAGTIRGEAPGAPPMPSLIYLGVPDVAETLAKVEAMGGDIAAPRFEVPGLVVLGLFRDPSGNAMGLVEMVGNERRIP